MIREVTQQVPVQEFRAVVTIKALHIKGKTDLDIFYLIAYTLSTFVPGRTVLGSGCQDVRHR